MANGKVHNIFLLDTEKVKRKLNVAKEISQTDIINNLMRNFDEKYKEQKIKEDIDYQGFQIKIYFYSKPSENKLAKFCSSFVESGQDIVQKIPLLISSVMFVYAQKHVFVITTGQGFRVVEDLCINNFGLLSLNIFKDTFKILATGSNTMSSKEHSKKIIYATEVDLVDINMIDTFYKEVSGKVNDEAIVKEFLNLEENSKKSSMRIFAKNSLQFGNSLDFTGLLHLLKLLDNYDYEKFQDIFNLITPINEKKEENIVKLNENTLIMKMYNDILNNKFEFDIFHRNTNQFIEMDEYKISDQFNEYISVDNIDKDKFIKGAYETYLRVNNVEDNIKSFSNFIFNCKLSSSKDGVEILSDSILKHITGEIEVKNKNYYVFYGQYFYINNAYNDRLDKLLQLKLTNERYDADCIETVWTKEMNEDAFNESCANAENLIHLHKIKPDFIEFADLLKVEKDRITVFHVKDGFDCEMRALDRQVELSILKLLDLKHNNNEKYFRNLYKNARSNKVGVNIKNICPTVEQFLKKLRENEIRYIIAIRPKNKDLIKSSSNIAKYCLNSLILKSFNQGIDLKIKIL